MAEGPFYYESMLDLNMQAAAQVGGAKGLPHIALRLLQIEHRPNAFAVVSVF